MMLHSNGLRSLPQLHVNDKVRLLQKYCRNCCSVLGMVVGANDAFACSSSVMLIPYKNWKTLGSSRMS